MPESPEQLYHRAAKALRMPPVGEWDTFPFEGEMRPRSLTPPLREEIPRKGKAGVDCLACAARDSDYG